MKLEIYDVRLGSDGRRELDPNSLVAKIDIHEGKAEFRFTDPSREKRLREVFENNVSFFSGGGTSGGVSADALTTHAALSDEAVFHLLQWVLPMELNLCGAVIDPYGGPDE